MLFTTTPRPCAWAAAFNGFTQFDLSKFVGFYLHMAWAPRVITLACKVQLFPFSEPFLVLQSPGIYSIPPASWLGLCCLFPAAQRVCYSITVLFYSLFAYCCWALSWVSQLRQCLSKSQRSSMCMWMAQFGLCSSTATVVLSSPGSPVMVEHQTSLTQEGAFRLLLQQANSHSLIKTSQTG